MATTVLSNTGIKIAGGGTVHNSSGISFSTSSTQYAIISVTSAASTQSVTVGTAIIAVATSGVAGSSIIYVPPSKTVTSTTTLDASWVIFENN